MLQTVLLAIIAAVQAIIVTYLEVSRRNDKTSSCNGTACNNTINEVVQKAMTKSSDNTTTTGVK